MSVVLRGLTWVVSFVPLLSFGVLTWPLFAVLAARARSWPLGGAALGYLGSFALEIWSVQSDPPHHTVLAICLSLLMVGGTLHAITVRPRWFRRAWRRPVPVESGEHSMARTAGVDVGASECAMVSDGGGKAEPVLNESAGPAGSVQRLLDEIDLLVEESLRDGERYVGFDYDDPAFPMCPNPYCDEPWHGLAITARMAQMREYGEVDLDYDYHADDSPVLCPGSTFEGGWEPEPAAWWDSERFVAQAYSPPPDPGPDPVTAAQAQADTLWMAIARPAVLIVVASWLLALVWMFLAPSQWRWSTVIVGAVGPVWIGWLYGRQGRLFPAGLLRARVRARPASIAAVMLMVIAGWLPLHWARNPLLDPADGYFTLVFACALACLGHAVVQIGRVRPAANESPDEASELDPKAHGEKLFILGFSWMLFALPVTLLFGWILGFVADQPRAMWAAVGVLAVLVLTFFLEATVVKIWTKARDAGDIPMIVFFTIGVGALLVWSLLQI
ncbi:hypothetical protein [Nocardia sp. R6R-6]|uniref:hypothetical protein n=1 Tax=Nocardia sp. R6R-6 TaxID=3459303 RepID=UPI00403D93ED